MSNSPRLILLFDINGTITSFDSTDIKEIVDVNGQSIKVTPQDNANMLIAKSTSGIIVNDQWIKDDHCGKDSITYYNHVRNTTPHYKLRSFEFTTAGQPGESLNHLVPRVVDSFTKLVFDSFLTIVEQYPEAVIILRTFGADSNEILQYLANQSEIISRRFEKTKLGTISHQGKEPIFNLESGTYTLDQFNELLKTLDTPLALTEDYHYWQANKRTAECGKVIKSHPQLIQIFFDDNPCVHIVNSNSTTHFIPINTVRAIDEPYYYVEIVKNIFPQNFPLLKNVD